DVAPAGQFAPKDLQELLPGLLLIPAYGQDTVVFDEHVQRQVWRLIQCYRLGSYDSTPGDASDADDGKRNQIAIANGFVHMQLAAVPRLIQPGADPAPRQKK